MLCSFVCIPTMSLHLNFQFDSFTLSTVFGLDLIVWSALMLEYEEQFLWRQQICKAVNNIYLQSNFALR